jgi:hypothetical protein
VTALDFFDVEIALRFAQDNLDVKKVLAPSKNPAKWRIMCFSRLKNIKSLTSKNSGTLIVIIRNELQCYGSEKLFIHLVKMPINNTNMFNMIV